MSTAMTWRETDLDTPDKRSQYTVTIMGCGRTGLLTACLFANANFKVIAVDSNPYVINLIRKGKIPSADPKLAGQVKKHVREGRIKATNQTKEATSAGNIIVFAIPPTLDQKKKPDYSNIENGCREAGLGLRAGCLAIVENTVGPGITETSVKESLEKSSGLKAGTDFGLAYTTISASTQPTLHDAFTHPKVVGAMNEQSLKAASLALRTIGDKEIIKVANIKTAEVIALLQNVYRDVNHALAAELALFCEKAGIDFSEIQQTLGAQYHDHPPTLDLLSWYFSIHPYLLLDEAENINAELHIAAVSRKINAEMLNHVLRLTRDALRSCGKTIRRATVSVIGVSSRPDVREINQPFLKQLVLMLARNGAKVHVYDPQFTQKQLIELEYPAEKTFRKSIEGADCLIFTAGHERFKRLNLGSIRFFTKQPAVIVDLANAFDSSEAKRQGFVYVGLGKGL